MMFTNIQKTPKAVSAPLDPAQQVSDLLLGCHDRIRYFTDLAAKLARIEGAPGTDIAGAAERIVRYFSVALPLHEADENLSLHPRLKAAHAGPRLFAAIDAMLQEHVVINQTLAQLLPLWKRVQQEPSVLPSLSSQLIQLTEELQRLFEDHLKLEEEGVFPAIERLLTPQQIGDLAEEMRARRAK